MATTPGEILEFRFDEPMAQNWFRSTPALDDEIRERFEQSLGAALQALPPGTLPLQAGCSQGGRVDDSNISVTVLRVERHADPVLARVGIFFTEVIGGCNCNEDPVEVNAYCLLVVRIDRATGNAAFTELTA